MSFALDKPVATGVIRTHRIDTQDFSVQDGQQIGRRQAGTDMRTPRR
jgi:hypothetical protein